MKSKPILIHTHFHYQRTGVTRSIENVIPYLATNYDTYVYGNTIHSRKISFIKVLKLVLSKKYFVLHCHRNNEIIRALFFRFLGGNFKLVSTRHAEAKPSSLTTFLLQKTDIIISLTKSMAANLPFPTVVIGHGVDTHFFKPNPKNKIATIPQDKIISCAGRVRKAKGHEVLLQAVCPLLKNQPNWALVIVGKVDKPAFLEKLKEIVKKNNVENQIYFLNETSNIAAIYQASHTVVVPSFTEGFSLVCAEAMACGCNVVATEHVGIHSELIIPNQNGYLFEAGNTMQLQDIMEKILTSGFDHLGLNARKTIEENYSAKTEADNLINVYRKEKP